MWHNNFWYVLTKTYQHSVKSHTLSSLNVSDAIFKEQLKEQKYNDEKHQQI